MNAPTELRLPISFSLRNGRECLIRVTAEEDATQLGAILPKMHAESPWLNYMPGEFDRSVEWGRSRGLRKMYLKTFEGNDRAIALYEALGFKTEARLRDDFLRNDGTFGDTITMSLYYPSPVHGHDSSGPASSLSS